MADAQSLHPSLLANFLGGPQQPIGLYYNHRTKQMRADHRLLEQKVREAEEHQYANTISFDTSLLGLSGVKVAGGALAYRVEEEEELDCRWVTFDASEAMLTKFFPWALHRDSALANATQRSTFAAVPLSSLSPSAANSPTGSAHMPPALPLGSGSLTPQQTRAWSAWRQVGHSHERELVGQGGLERAGQSLYAYDGFGMNPMMMMMGGMVRPGMFPQMSLQTMQGMFPQQNMMMPNMMGGPQRPMRGPMGPGPRGPAMGQGPGPRKTAQPKAAAGRNFALTQQARNVQIPEAPAAGPGAPPAPWQPEALTAQQLAAAPPAMQKRLLGERLFPSIARLQPELASKITGVMLEMDNAELLILLESEGALKAKVDEVMRLLEAPNKAA